MNSGFLLTDRIIKSDTQTKYCVIALMEKTATRVLNGTVKDVHV